MQKMETRGNCQVAKLRGRCIRTNCVSLVARWSYRSWMQLSLSGKVFPEPSSSYVLEACVGNMCRIDSSPEFRRRNRWNGTASGPRYLPPVGILLFKVSKLRGYLLRVPRRNKPFTRHSHKQRRLSTRQSFETQVESSITMFSVESNGYT